MGLTALWAAVGVVLMGGGAFVVLRLRRAEALGDMRLAGVGPLSRVTRVIIGLALLGAGYHVLVHALGVMRHFRAPLEIAIGVAIVAVLGSIGVDALENRLSRGGDDGDRDGGPGEGDAEP